MTNELQTWTRKPNAIKAVEKKLAALLDEERISEGLDITGIEAENVGTDKAAFAVTIYVYSGETVADAKDFAEAVADFARVVWDDGSPIADVEAEEAPAMDEDVSDAMDAQDRGELEPEEAPADLFSALATKPKRKAPADDSPLAALGEFGNGSSEEDAECPHCGINHRDNGYGRHEPEHPNDEREHSCLACGGEWGKKIGRRTFKGRRSTKKGERYTLKDADATNPYRPGSQSHAAFEILRSNPGITREEFVAKGGRARTLSEDVRHDRVNVEAPE